MDKNFEVTELDPNVEAVRKKIAARSSNAKSKYGVDTTRRDYSEVDWLLELQEELMDATVYIEALLANVTRAVEADIRRRNQNVL
tara:strand:- start:1421 stop:1675 length:255 start_codon:yes stop_codon:yes gene_type:complete